jgi:hypothetical protein
VAEEEMRKMREKTQKKKKYEKQSIKWRRVRKRLNGRTGQ